MPPIRNQRERHANKSSPFEVSPIELKSRQQKKEEQSAIDEIESKLANLRLPKAAQNLRERNINTMHTIQNNDVLLPYEFYFGEENNENASKQIAQQNSVPQYLKNVPMKNEPWYFGRIPRMTADNLLHVASVGQFLVRDSESNFGGFTISMRGLARNKHFDVSNINGMLKIGNETFLSMNTLINYYKINPILSSPTEHLYLTEPLPKELSLLFV